MSEARSRVSFASSKPVTRTRRTKSAERTVPVAPIIIFSIRILQHLPYHCLSSTRSIDPPSSTQRAPATSALCRGYLANRGPSLPRRRRSVKRSRRSTSTPRCSTGSLFHLEISGVACAVRFDHIADSSPIFRVTTLCSAKCIPNDYRESDLNKGESVCLDRCVAKFFECNMKISEKMQELGGQAAGAAPGGPTAGLFGR